MHINCKCLSAKLHLIVWSSAITLMTHCLCRQILYPLFWRGKSVVSCITVTLQLTESKHLAERHRNNAGQTKVIVLKASPTWQAACGLLCGGPSLFGVQGTSGSWASSWSRRMSCRIPPCTQTYHHWSHRWWGTPLFSYSKQEHKRVCQQTHILIQ